MTRVGSQRHGKKKKNLKGCRFFNMTGEVALQYNIATSSKAQRPVYVLTSTPCMYSQHGA
jgi:hypothetical protein